MQFSKEQLAVIGARGSDMLVSASAGSGKTTVMIERVLQLIGEGAQLKKMLISTFTKAAAEDMREKLMRALTERADANERYLTALQQLPQAQISTLHAFCGRLARTYFYAIELDPAFEILGDGDAALLDRCVDEVVENAEGEDFERLYEILLAGRKDKSFKNSLKKLYRFAVALPRPREWLRDCLNGYGDDGTARAEIENDLEKEREKLSALCDNLLVETQAAGFTRNVPGAQALLRALGNYSAEPLSVSPRGSVPAEFFDLNEDFKYLKKKVQSFLLRCDDVRGLRSSADAMPYAAVLRDLTLQVYDAYEEQKRKKGVADYNDLEHFAYDILSSEQGERIRAGYDYVFVDEYQDINPLQDAIVSLLKRGGNLFMVGDLKQSIYAFRGCDPSIFARKQAAFRVGREGVNAILNANYRTDPAVIERVNDVFSRCMTAAFGGVDYRNEAQLAAGLQAGGGQFRYVNVATDKDREEPALHGVYSVSRHEQISEENAAEAESDFLVGEIMKLLTEGGVRGERVFPADVAVLTRAGGRLNRRLKAKLKSLGVEAFVKEKSCYAGLAETAPLVAVLRLLDNRFDDVALACALLSFYGGCDEDDLALVGEQRRTDEPFYAAAERSELLLPFYEKINRYCVLAQSLSAAELLGHIVTENDAFTQVLKMEDGDTRAKNLSDFLALAAANPAFSVRDFLEYLDGGSGADESAPEGCLKIMTVHMSKGLEFGYVFVAGVHRRFNKTDFNAPMLLDTDLGLAFKYPDEEQRRKLPTALTEAVKLKNQRKFLEEELRIFYVALTRAKKFLCVSGCNVQPRLRYRQSEPPACPADFLDGLFPETVSAASAALQEERPAYVPVFANGDEETAAEISRRCAFVYPHAQAAAKSTVTAVAHAEWEREGYEYGAAAFADGDEDAARRGTAYHLALQTLDFSRPLEPQKEAFAHAFPEECVWIDFEKVNWAAKSVRALTAGYTLYKEKEFVMDVEGTLVQGVVDLLAERGGEAIIVDYKTGLNPDKPQYRRQLALYAEAVERVLGWHVRAAYVCALDARRMIEM